MPKFYEKQPQSTRRKLKTSQGIKRKRKRLRQKRVVQVLLESLCFPKQCLRRFLRKGREDLEATEGMNLFNLYRVKFPAACGESALCGWVFDTPLLAAGSFIDIFIFSVCSVVNLLTIRL
jgi:hypothetical protein